LFKDHIKILSIKSNYRCWLKSPKGVYATLLKSSVAMIETPEWRIFLMKDMAAFADNPNKSQRCRTVRYCMPEETGMLKREKER